MRREMGIRQAAPAVKRPSITTAEFQGLAEISEETIRDIWRFGREQHLNDPKKIVAQLRLSKGKIDSGKLVDRLIAGMGEVERCFDEGVGKTLQFDKERDRAPTQIEMWRDLGMRQFLNRMYRGQFEYMRVADLHSLFKYLKLEPHEARKDTWVGREGLDRGVEAFWEFREAHARWPSTKEARKIKGLGRFITSLYSGAYKDFGVSNYTELLAYAVAFKTAEKPLSTVAEGQGIALYVAVTQALPSYLRREVTLNAGVTARLVSTTLRKAERALEGEAREIFVDGVQKIWHFFELNGKSPTQTEMRRELDMNAFEGRMHRGQFRIMKVTDLNTLFERLGMDPHKNYDGTWIGQTGLDRGAQLLAEYHKEHSRWPGLKQAREIDGMGTFFKNLYTGLYKPYGVSNYHEAVAYAKSKYDSGLPGEDAMPQGRIPTLIDTVAATQYLRDSDTGLAGIAAAQPHKST